MKNVAVAACFLVFTWQVYRAAAIPVTDLEAIAYNNYVSQPALNIFTSPYNPANQILHSLLCRGVLQAMRLTEFALRIPSLLGLLLYFWAAFQLIPPVSKIQFLALCALVINPFTIGWLPQSTGVWMASGLFLIGLRQLKRFGGDPRTLAPASVAFGLSGSFYIPFCFAAVAVLLLFLHFEFWGRRRLSVIPTINNVLLPAALIIFCVWSLPFSRANSESLTLPALLPNPGKFTTDSAPNLPRVARQLRDDIRRHPTRPISVAANSQLVNRMDFYRRRYALGAVQKILTLSSSGSADYIIGVEPLTGQAKLKATMLVEMHQ